MDITIRELHKSYSKKVIALQNVTLDIGLGMFGLLGPNGAGKTTLLRILATLIRPTCGSVKMNGYRTDHPEEKWFIRKTLGYLPQELSLYGALSAREFLAFMAALKEVPVRQRKQSIDAVLEATSLLEVADRRLHTYSGGMKRRVGVAQALLGNPELLIIDEPTVGLDPQERVRLRNLLVRLAADRTVILSTHIIEDVEQTCKQIAILQQGALLFNGTVHDFTQTARGAVWQIDTTDHGSLSFTNAMVLGMTSNATQTTYRVLAGTKPHETAQLTEPTLEDAYLFHQHNQQAVGEGSGCMVKTAL